MAVPDDLEPGDIVVRQGKTWVQEWEWRQDAPAGSVGAAIPIAGNDFEARIQIRKKPGSSDVYLSFDSATDAEFVVEPDGLVGVLRLTVGATVTEGYTWKSGELEIELYDPTDPDRVEQFYRSMAYLDPEVVT